METYFDPRAPGSFGGVDALYRQVKGQKKTKADVKEWLSDQNAYTMHVPVRRKFKQNRTVAYTINEQFQADLADLSSLASKNDGFRYLLTCIDIFSKHAWVVPLKNKGAIGVCEALEAIFEERTPEKFQTDEGKEFVNEKCKELFKRYDINHFHALSNSETKCAVVERFNRTLKTKMWKYLTYKNTYRYIDVLPDLVHSYNNTYHSAIKMKPSEVSHANVKQVWDNMHGKYFAEEIMCQQPPSKKTVKTVKKGKQKIKYKFQVGDHVRLSSTRVVFRKGYEEGWTEEVHIVSKRLPRIPPVYVVKDQLGEEIKGVFYEQELQRVKKPEVFKIDRVLKRRGKGKRAQVFVKWVGYPDSFNKWIPEKQVVDI
jgi:hypothetical protein